MSIYGLGGVASRAIQFLLLPVYTRVLTTADYGSLEMVYIVVGVLGMVYGFMISSGYLRCYYDSREEDYRSLVLGSAFWFTLVSSIIFAAISFIFADKIAGIIFKFDGGAYFIRLITISAAIKAHSMVFYNVLMAREQARRYVTINVLTLLLTMLITVYFVVVLKMGVEGILMAQIIAYSFEFLVLAYYLLRTNIFRFSITAAKEMLNFSIPLIPLQVASFILAMSDRFFIQEYRSLDDVGLYSLGYKFASILPLLTIEPFKGFGPHIFALINQPDKCKQTLADFARYYMAGALGLALAVAMFSREIVMVMSDPAFHSSYRIVFVLCLAYVFYGLYSFSCYANNIVKKNWLISLSWIIAVLVSISLNFYLVPKYGMTGAMITSVIAYFVLVLSNLIGTSYIYPIRYKYSYFVAMLAFTSLVYYLSSLITLGIIASIGLKILILAVYIIVIFKSGYFNEAERRKILSILRLSRE